MKLSARTLIRTALTLGFTAAATTLASPAMAASSDGAVVTNQTTCRTSGTETECVTAKFVRNTVTTPSGITSLTENGGYSYAANDPWYGTSRSGTTSYRYHRLADSNDENIELSNHLKSTQTVTPGGTCTYTGAVHYANGHLRSSGEGWVCTP